MTDVFMNKSTQTVHKVYHDKSNSPFKLNVNLIRHVGQLERVTEEKLTTDGKIHQLCYRYVEGDQTPKTVKQFVGVTDALQKVHKLGFVHGDVRRENMVFTTNGTSSYLIDFDLAQKEEEGYYPLEYNTTGIPRHPDATPGKPMKKEHDRYALAEVISKQFVLNAQQQQQK